MGEILVNLEEQPAYYSYLLRLWQEDKQGNTWRMSLENVQTGERIGYANLDHLFGYLSQRIEISPQLNLYQDPGGEVVP